MANIKSQLFQFCQQSLLKRIEDARVAISDLQESANEETKSSAGDKYETGRAMMQLEIEKHTTQLGELLKQKQVLDQINIDRTQETVQFGAVVRTNQGNFFISINGGQFLLEGESFIRVSR